MPIEFLSILLVRSLRVDLLGESPEGELIHIELQSRNEKDFPLRMGEYSFAVALRHGRLGTEPGTVRRILNLISAAPSEQREEALAELLIVAGLRKLDDNVRREAKLIPIQEDIMDHSVIGPAIRRGLEKGRVEGRVEGQLELLLEQIEERFGAVPARVRKRLAALDTTELKAAGRHLIKAQRIEDLFSR